MASISKRKAPPGNLLGLGPRCDGHKRLTTGPNFILMGRVSQETHAVMTEKAVKINENLLSAAGKLRRESASEEFDD